MSKVTIKNILDPAYARKVGKGFDLKVALKKGKKGTSLYAKKLIKKGAVVAYYKFLVCKYDDNFKGYRKDMYVMTVYTKANNISTYLGDIYPGSLEKPRNGVPFWAYFSNEPSGDQPENVYLDVNLKENYKNRNRVKPGETMIYKLKAVRDIKPGEEICWCYGSEYIRNYKVNCEDI